MACGAFTNYHRDHDGASELVCVCRREKYEPLQTALPSMASGAFTSYPDHDGVSRLVCVCREAWAIANAELHREWLVGHSPAIMPAIILIMIIPMGVSELVCVRCREAWAIANSFTDRAAAGFARPPAPLYSAAWGKAMLQPTPAFVLVMRLTGETIGSARLGVTATLADTSLVQIINGMVCPAWQQQMTTTVAAQMQECTEWRSTAGATVIMTLDQAICAPPGEHLFIASSALYVCVYRSTCTGSVLSRLSKIRIRDQSPG